MKKLMVFLFLSATGLNVQVIGREPQALLTHKDCSQSTLQKSKSHIAIASACYGRAAIQQDTLKSIERHTGKAVRDRDLEEQMNNDPDNRDRSIPNTTVERDSANIPEL